MSENVNPKRLNELGDKFFEGIDTPKNIELAYTYYKQAADSGNPIGLYNVGKYFLAKEDYKKAQEFLSKSLMSGYSKAHLLLAYMSLSGKGIRKSKKRAFKYVSEGVKLGDTDAYNQLARFYRKGIGCSKDDIKAKEHFQLSADKGNSEGMYELALMMLEEPKSKRDPSDALHWLDKAALAGYEGAIRKLINIYEAPHPSFKKRSKTFLAEMIFYYHELLARKNDKQALETVSLDYFEGTAVTKRNVEKASEYFQMLLKHDSTIGHFGVGACLIEGYGPKTDRFEAIKELEIAASRDYQQAMIKLAEIYKSGTLGKSDPELAKKWYYEAAKKNDPDALTNLGLLHYRNEITNASDELAHQYMENAMKKGGLQALYWLGIFKEKGIGCQVNPIQAEKLFQKAIEQGVAAAKYKYAVMLFERGLKTNSKGKAQKDFSRAKTLFLEYFLYQQHSRNNAAFSAYYLGSMYEDGLGVNQSKRTSRFWFETAAEMGYHKAMVEMFRILKNVEAKPAIAWLEIAAKGNEPIALYELGCLYLDGFDYIQKDASKGKAYLEAAANLGYKQALDRLTML
ncbi:MAG: sel1 repeat family protein [Bacilli bacterium]|nr:sel1 repeat family protein [Bacilli bacterium]